MRRMTVLTFCFMTVRTFFFFGAPVATFSVSKCANPQRRRPLHRLAVPALNGGDLNWIDPNSLVPEFREVMAKTPSGQLSEPFKSPYGWHVLEVLGRRATDSSEQYREQQAMNVLRNRKYDEELQAWLRQIRDEAYVEVKL